MGSPFNRLIQIGIIKNHIRTFPFEFEPHVLQINTCSGLHDLHTYDSAPGERDLVDLHVLADSHAGSVTVSYEHAEDARGNLAAEASSATRRGVSSDGFRITVLPIGCQGRANFQGHHEDCWEFPEVHLA